MKCKVLSKLFLKVKRLFYNLPQIIKELLFCLTTLVTLSVVFAALFPDQQFAKLLTLDRTDISNIFTTIFCDFNWLQGILLICLIAAVCFSLSNCWTSIKDIFEKQWVKCKGFPCKDRLCGAIESCLSRGQIDRSETETLIWKPKREQASSTLSNEELVWEFFTLISQFLVFSKKSIVMTLTKEPYKQLNDTNQWGILTSSFASIETRLQKEAIRKFEKTIILSKNQFKSFLTALVQDLKKLKEGKQTDFEKYLNEHERVGCKLNWFATKRHTYIKEFIIIDEAVLISLPDPNPDHIELCFSTNRIDTEIRKLKSLCGEERRHTSTSVFIEENIIPEIKRRINTWSDGDQILILDFLEKLKSR